MTDKQFWSIADMYEAFDKDMQSYVPAKNIKELVEVVFETNKHDYNESLADLSLFRFKVCFYKVKYCLDNLQKNYLQTNAGVL